MDSGKAEPKKPLWRTASYSVGNGACIEVSSVNGSVLVRDSKIQDSPIIGYSCRDMAVVSDRNQG